MNSFVLMMVLSTIFGLSIFLSLPVVYSRRAQGSWSVALNAVAIGILVFLLADIFSDVSPYLYPSSNSATVYLADPRLTAFFTIGFLLAFLGLFAVDSERFRVFARSGAQDSPAQASSRTALVIAIGIGLQNLTEGLVFGANWVQSGAFAGFLAVIFLGFFLQNVTEGFPIASPFLGGEKTRDLSLLTGLFLIGGVPTLMGSWLGYSITPSPAFIVFVDALAIGAIGYAILPMLRVAFRPLADRAASVRRNEIVYIGAMVGFLIGFLTNAI